MSSYATLMSKALAKVHKYFVFFHKIWKNFNLISKKKMLYSIFPHIVAHILCYLTYWFEGFIIYYAELIV